jgi:hypothetical protein
MGENSVTQEARPLLARRKVMDMNGSAVIVLPAEWVRLQGILPGDVLTFVTNGGGDLKILAPKHVPVVEKVIAELVDEKAGGLGGGI